MKKYLKILFLLGSVAFLQKGKAQQDALYSQYMFNPFAINPAYAGSRDAISGVLLTRQQWSGMDGAPRTQTLAIHGPLKENKMAFGLNLFNDRIGPTRNTGIAATYGYIIDMGKAKLSFALRGGVFNSFLDNSLLNYKDPTDRFSNTTVAKALVPTFDFGTYFHTHKFYAGFSVTHLLENSVRYDGLPDDAFTSMKRHFMLSSGFAQPLGANTVIKPSVMIRYVMNAPVNIDLNCSFLFRKVFWLGASYRTDRGVVLIGEYNITDFLRIGYSYDIVMSQLKQFTRGSHEIMMGFDFNLKKTQVISPRYL